MAWLNDFQHWFYTAVFVLLAWSFLRNPARFAATCSYFCNIKTDEWVHARIMDASVRRKRLENISPNLGYYLGALNAALAVLCGVTRVQPSLWYAVSIVGMAAVSAGAYLQLRNSQRRRVAVLAVRSPGRAISPYWIPAVLLCALTPLVDLPDAPLRLTAITVCIATLIIAFIGWRLLLMPALLEGADLPAEQYVDDQLRSRRSMGAFAVAIGVPFVYLAQTSVPPPSVAHMIAQEATFAAGFALTWIFLRPLKRGPSANELRDWNAQGAAV